MMELGDRGALLREDGCVYSPPVKNLDRFLRCMYEYHTKHGLVGCILEGLSTLLVHVFVMGVTGLTLGGIDWNGVFGVTTHAEFASFVSMGVGLRVYAGVCVSLLVVEVSMWVCRLPNRWNMRRFYRDRLNIHDTTKHTWVGVVGRLIEAHNTGPRVVVALEHLTPLDVATRVLRRTNYVVLLLDNGVLGDNEPNEVLMWNLWVVVLAPMFYPQDWKLSLDVAGVRRRCYWMMVANVCFMPIMVAVFCFYYLLRASERVANRKATFSVRLWDERTYWKTRRYNEYPATARRRLRRAAVRVDRSLTMIPYPISRLMLSTVQFVSGSLVGCITALTFISEETLTRIHIADHNLLWWVAICGAIYSTARVATIERQAVEVCPEGIAAERGLIRGDLGVEDDWVFEDHYRLFFVHWFEMVRSIVRMPVVLRRWSLSAPRIVELIREHTEFNTLAGDVCVEGLLCACPLENEASVKLSSSHRSFKSMWDMEV